MSTKKPSKSVHEPALKSFADHLGELRTRLAWVAVVFIVASALAYNVREQLVSVVLSPIGDQQLVYLTPAGGFAFIFQVTLYAGMLVTAPLAVYHLYKFVAPALPGNVRHRSINVVAVSTLLMLAGVAFGYFVAIPAALQFLTTFAGGFVQPNLTADSYLSFVVAYLLGLGLLFQLPLLLVVWNWIQPFGPGGLLGTQRYVLVGSFIAAAMITPTPDIVNQCLIAVPIVAIYQLGVIAVYFMNRRQRGQARALPPAPMREVMNVDVPLWTEFAEPPVPPQPPASRPPVPQAKPLSAQKPIPKPSLQPISIDGFRPVRRTVLDVPPSRSTIRNVAASRPSVARPAPPRLRRPQTSLDGFAFQRSPQN
jgi:sec-independent protein translocase protein TatC